MATEDHKSIEQNEDIAEMEVPEELLEALAGGWMNDELRDHIRSICADAKHRGNDREVYKRFLRRKVTGTGVGYWELCDYIDEIWSSL